MSHWYKEEVEPEYKRKFIELKTVHYLWNGKSWEYMNTRYGETHVGQTRDEIIAFMESKQNEKST